MYHIAIVEDTEADSEKLIAYIEKYKKEHLQSLDYLLFHNAESLTTNYRPAYDLIFMDIELPIGNGMDAAKQIRRLDPDVTIVFITNLSRFAVKGYEVGALDYILKPLNYTAFTMKMNRIIKHLDKSHETSLTIHTKNGIHRIAVSKLLFVEVQTHQLLFHTDDGIIETRGSLKQIEEQLLPFHFLRCNNCYLVNLRHIQALKDNNVIIGNYELPISRPKKKNFLDGFTKYLGV